jgi:hypothetical protein
MLLVPDWTADRVMTFDPVTGNLINANFIVDPAHLASPKNAIMSGRGTILVSDQINDVVQEYSASGTYIGVFAPAGGPNPAILDNIRGITLRPNGNLLVTVGGGTNTNTVAEFDSNGSYVGNFIAAGSGGLSSPFDVYYRATAQDYLVTGSSSDAVHRYSATGAYLGNLITGVNFPQQVREALNTNILVAIFSTPSGVGEFTASGTPVGMYAPVTGNRGVYELPNGNILTTTDDGVYEINRSGQLVSTKITGANAQYIELVTLPSGGGCVTPSPSVVATASMTRTSTVVASVTSTVTRTNTPGAVPSMTVSTATRTVTVQPTNTVQPTITVQPTVTIQPTMIQTATVAPSLTATGTSTVAPTRTGTATGTATVAPSTTSTVGATMTGTSTVAPTRTQTQVPCSGRVTICHRTGNGNSHTISISCNALPAHMRHGDTVGACPAATPRPRGNNFRDVNSNDYFYEHTLDLRDAEAITGYDDGTFRPYNQATRAQLVKIVVLAFNIRLYTGNAQQFSDVPTTHPFYKYIMTAWENNIITGYDNGTFRPYANVTRGQIAKIAVESARMDTLLPETPSFRDVPTDHTFYRYIETAYANGILSGYENGTFRPDADATRGQITKIVNLATHPDTER